MGGTKEGCQAIKDGDMQGSAFHFSYLVGVYTARAAWDVAHGRPLTPFIEVPTLPLDRNNVDAVTDFQRNFGVDCAGNHALDRPSELISRAQLHRRILLATPGRRLAVWTALHVE